MTDSIKCPLCDKTFASRQSVQAHLLSRKHKNGNEVIDKIDWLITNLAEAQRAVEIYRTIAREPKPQL